MDVWKLGEQDAGCGVGWEGSKMVPRCSLGQWEKVNWKEKTMLREKNKVCCLHDDNHGLKSMSNVEPWPQCIPGAQLAQPTSDGRDTFWAFVLNYSMGIMHDFEASNKISTRIKTKILESRIICEQRCLVLPSPSKVMLRKSPVSVDNCKTR